MKKAGIIIGATAAGLLALSPLAFADTPNGGDGVDKDSTGLVSGANSNNVQLPVEACNNNINGVGFQATDATGLLGGGSANGDACGQTANTGDSGN